eukprot:s3169_g1.t1
MLRARCHVRENRGLCHGEVESTLGDKSTPEQWNCRVTVILTEFYALELMSTLTELKDFYQVDGNVWQAFVDCAGDPGDDLRLLAVLPASVLTASLERAALPDGSSLTAIQAAHAGLIYNLRALTAGTRTAGYDCSPRHWKGPAATQAPDSARDVDHLLRIAYSPSRPGGTSRGRENTPWRLSNIEPEPWHMTWDKTRDWVDIVVRPTVPLFHSVCPAKGKNFWNAVYDFTGKADGANWRILSLGECRELELHLGDAPGEWQCPSPELSHELLCTAPLKSSPPAVLTPG